MLVAGPQQQTSQQRPLGPDADVCAAEDCHKHGKTLRASILLVLVCLIPYWMIPFSHLASDPTTATGFFNYELPYYVANGRAAFDRGNGFSYPNPYLPDDEAPAIYAHWLLWFMGVAVAAGIDPGDLIFAGTLASSLVFAWATWCLAGLRVRNTAGRRTAFAVAMLGGGGLVLGGIVSLISGEGSVLAHDPSRGLWFLNWGRNCLFPTEAIYHSLVAGCWISEIRKRQKTANVFLILLATTHPWSGVELLLTVNLFRAINWLRLRDRQSLVTLAASATALGAFLAYYKIWLPSFPTHAALQHVWQLNWRVENLTALLAWGPVFAAALVQIIRRWQRLSRSEWFLICAFVTSSSLSLHDRIMPPVQPLHFTRGYVWMPLFLLGLPIWLIMIETAWRHMKQRPVIWRSLAGVITILLIAADNLTFAAVHVNRQLQRVDGFHISSGERTLLQSLSQPLCRNHVTLTESETLNYLLPTWAPVRPWMGHQFNTPNYADRKKVWEQCFTEVQVSAASVPAEVTQLIVREDTDTEQLPGNWTQIKIRNADWEIWQRTSPDSQLTGD